ncbi:choice-of-anchor P family protein [Actinocorallia lasiicapitis]
MLSGAKRFLAVTAIAGAGALCMQQPGIADPATLSAYGVSISALGTTLAAVPLATGANSTQTILTIPVNPLVNSGTIEATTTTDPGTGVETAFAETQDLAISLAGLATLSASAITATCTATPGQAPTGSATVANGVLNDVLPLTPPIVLAANPAPNTVVGIPGVLTLTLNEQINNPDGSLTVNAAHLSLLGPGGGNIIISSATCGPALLPVSMVSSSVAVAAGGLAVLAIGAFGTRRMIVRGRTTA